METDETVREVCDKMLNPDSTCKACDFVQCPMLVKFASEVAEAYEREMAAKDAEIARLKAALKPVIEHDLRQYGHQRQQPSIVLAVREAQRVMREGGAK